MTDLERVELAVRRVVGRLKMNFPQNFDVIEALEAIADELVPHLENCPSTDGRSGGASCE